WSPPPIDERAISGMRDEGRAMRQTQLEFVPHASSFMVHSSSLNPQSSSLIRFPQCVGQELNLHSECGWVTATWAHQCTGGSNFNSTGGNRTHKRSPRFELGRFAGLRTVPKDQSVVSSS